MKTFLKQFTQSPDGYLHSLLDDISAEVGAMSDEDIRKAAEQILERKAKLKASMTPDRAQKMKDREKARRQKNSAILKLAKDRGLVTEEKA